MKKEAQRIAITEACGTNNPHWWCPACLREVSPQMVRYNETHDGCGALCEFRDSPDYLNDWNTRQEMLRVIIHRGDLASFGAAILKTFGHPEIIDEPTYFVWIGASCDQPQFCEAFLRVLGKWVEE